jgi:hypothetical protein
MRTIPRIILVASAAVLALTGCVQRDAIVTPAPVSSAKPIFANEQDALAAAEKAYAAYNDVSNKILQAGGLNPERIDAVVSAQLAADEIKGFQKYVERGYRSIGKTTFDHVVLQQYSPGSIHGSGIVSIYVCVDTSGVDVLDANGTSVVDTSRPSRMGFEVGFEAGPSPSHLLRVSSNDVWDSGDICV